MLPVLLAFFVSFSALFGGNGFHFDHHDGHEMGMQSEGKDQNPQPLSEKASPADACSNCPLHFSNYCLVHFAVLNAEILMPSLLLSKDFALKDYKNSYKKAPFLDGPFQPPRS